MALKKKAIKVFAPATVANLACGFDVMGLAIDAPGDVVELIPNNCGDLIIRRITGDKKKLSKHPLENAVTVSIAAYLMELGIRQGFDVILHKNLPMGSGMGSSSASSAAGVFAVNEILGRPLSKRELIRFAMEGERFACGAAHPDNVAPCILGGIVLCHPAGEYISLPVPEALHVVVLHPDVQVLTKDARAVLPSQIPLQIASHQWANTSALTTAFFRNDYDLMKLSMQDYVAEPKRKQLIPYFTDIKNAAMEHAVACSISGSGPAIFAIAKGASAAKKTAAAMSAISRHYQMKHNVYLSKVNKAGAKTIRS